MICLGARVSITEPCDQIYIYIHTHTYIYICFFYDNFLRTWPQSVSFYSTHLYSFSSLQSMPHAPMNPIPSYPRDTCVLFICYHRWKRNMHLLLLMHIDRTSPHKHNCAWRRWKTSSPIPFPCRPFLFHLLLLTFWLASSPMRGATIRGYYKQILRACNQHVPKYLCLVYTRGMSVLVHAHMWVLDPFVSPHMVAEFDLKCQAWSSLKVFGLLMKLRDRSRAVYEWRGFSGY